MNLLPSADCWPFGCGCKNCFRTILLFGMGNTTTPTGLASRSLYGSDAWTKQYVASSTNRVTKRHIYHGFFVTKIAAAVAVALSDAQAHQDAQRAAYPEGPRALAAAAREGLTLAPSKANKSGYHNVEWQGTGKVSPWKISGAALALVRASPGGGTRKSASYATPEGAALTIARARERSRVM